MWFQVLVRCFLNRQQLSLADRAENNKISLDSEAGSILPKPFRSSVNGLPNNIILSTKMRIMARSQVLILCKLQVHWSDYSVESLSRILQIYKQSEVMYNLKPKIVNHETQLNSKIVYVLQVTDQQSGKSKITKLRYSEFKNLHQELENVVTKLKLHIILPEFPSRKLFGSTNKSEQLIFERKKQLNSVYLSQMQYLTDLLSIQKLHCLDLVKKFFIPTENKEVQHPKEAHDINMQICIDRYTLVQDVVIYYVRLRDLNSHEEWTFKTRYSELRNVHQALEQSKIKNLPPFPKKKIFGITNESPENIEKRREQLQKYFNQIFNSKQVLRSDAIRYFIDQSKKQAQRDKELQALKKKKNQKI